MNLFAEAIKKYNPALKKNVRESVDPTVAVLIVNVDINTLERDEEIPKIRRGNLFRYPILGLGWYLARHYTGKNPEKATAHLLLKRISYISK